MNALSQVTLEEFSALMKGELSGRNPMEAVFEVFVTIAMSGTDGDREMDDLITVSKLQRVCKMFEVQSVCTFWL